jgi:superfamily II DNA or RNA helicase
MSDIPLKIDTHSSEKKGLRMLYLKDEYNTDDDDIVKDLYGPCLKLSKYYDRAVGYFRANIYRELGEELLDFVIKGGKVRLVCSPDIPEPDEQAAREGYQNRGIRETKYVESDLLKTLELMSKNPDEKDCLNMLSLLIEKEALELFIAIRPGGIYHRKVGVFIDEFGNSVVFSGSGNETRNAVTTIEDWSNDESFDVYRSWGDSFESRKAMNKIEYLKKLFSGGTKRTKVRLLNQLEKEMLAKFRTYSNFESCRQGAKSRSTFKESQPIDESEPIALKPYFYQEQAIRKWEQAGRIGLLSMATGTGKTITALFAIKDLVEKGRPILILVPSAVLMDQWLKALRNFFPNTPILCAGGGYNWKSIPGKRIYVDNVNLRRIILATMDTAVTDDFIEFFSQAKDPVLVVDEAHRLGSENHRKILNLNFSAKLGLSATPERLYDDEGTSALKQFFGEEPIFNLPMSSIVRLSENDNKEVPILGHFLSRYTYDFKIAHLSVTEQKTWDTLTSEIRRLFARNPDALKDNKSNRLMYLLIKRANIIKSASEKVEIANQVVSKEYSANERWIIYCQDERQLSLVYNTIKKSNPHLNVLQYHSGMNSDERDRTLRYFELKPSIIVSIRCLDEGVDVPAADGALILASSTNPREYIQRRGRVLRKAKGKRIAKIIDVLVLPDKPEQDKEVPVSIVRGEIARAYEFAKLAENSEINHELWKLCMEFNVDIPRDYEIGLEEN